MTLSCHEEKRKEKKRERRSFPLRQRKEKEDIKWSFCKRMVKRHSTEFRKNKIKNNYEELKKCSGHDTE